MSEAQEHGRAELAIDSDAPRLERVVADRYALVKRLGNGTLGIVYQARHTTLDRLVTLELLDAERVDREAVRDRFKDVMRRVARVRHRNVTTLEGSGVDADGSLYVVTKHIAAPRLHEVIDREGRLPWSRVRALASQLTAAVEAAHKRSIMHGGLWPGVCYVVTAASGSEQLMVGDFALGELAIETRFAADAKGATTRLAGDPRYLALEQFVSGKGSVAADVHAAGAVFYHALTGSPPYTGVNPFHALHQRRGRELAPPRAIEPSIPPEVEAVLLRALATKPEERYSSMRELGAALEAVPATLTVVPDGGRAPPPQVPAPGPSPALGPVPVPPPELVARIEPEDAIVPTQVMPAQRATVMEDEATAMLRRPSPYAGRDAAKRTVAFKSSPRPRDAEVEKTSLLGPKEIFTVLASSPHGPRDAHPTAVLPGHPTSTPPTARTGLPPTKRLSPTMDPAPLATELLAPPTVYAVPRDPLPPPAPAAPPLRAAAPVPTADRGVASEEIPGPTPSTARIWWLMLGAAVLVAVLGALVGLALARASSTETHKHSGGAPSPTAATSRSQP